MMKKRKKIAFTLVEMLVVVTIIAILAGMVFGLFTMVTRQAKKAQCIKMLEALANAINEYRGEYGQYPPVTNIKYEYENTNYQSSDFRDRYLPDNPGYTGTLYEFDNLVAHLWPRYRKVMWHMDNHPVVTNYGQWVGDSERDIEAKKRWAQFLEEISLEPDSEGHNARELTGANALYSNKTETILDPWDKEIHYSSPPPYLKYELWSDGPDRTPNTKDDIHHEKWDD